MPFWGAVRRTERPEQPTSALALITDSAYATLSLARANESGAAEINVAYARDAERRRLEIRLHPLPGGDHVAIARTYREKVIGDRQHVTLRRRVRDHPEADALLGGAFVTFPIHLGAGHEHAFADAAEIARDMKEHLGVERAVCLFQHWATDEDERGHRRDDSLAADRGAPPARAGAGGDAGLRQAIADIRALGYVAGVRGAAQLRLTAHRLASSDSATICPRSGTATAQTRSRWGYLPGLTWWTCLTSGCPAGTRWTGAWAFSRSRMNFSRRGRGGRLRLVGHRV
jgi:hypothetical protein